jgi:excisionase family DNA binding protein
MFENYRLQNVADMLKKFVNDRPIKSGDERIAKRKAREAIAAFETGNWNNTAFEQANIATGNHVRFDDDGKPIYVGDAVFDDVIAVLSHFAGLFPKPIEQDEPTPTSPDEMYTLNTEEAAAYLGVAVVTMKKYVHGDHSIEGKLVTGNTRLFSKAELDRHKARLSEPGRRGRPIKALKNEETR